MSKLFPICSQVQFISPASAPHPIFSTAPATVSDRNSSTISMFEISVLKGCSTSAATTPVNLIGGGSYRFPGPRPGDRRQLAAVIDAELGTPAREPIIRTDGVAAFVIPRRRR